MEFHPQILSWCLTLKCAGISVMFEQVIFLAPYILHCLLFHLQQTTTTLHTERSIFPFHFPFVVSVQVQSCLAELVSHHSHSWQTYLHMHSHNQTATSKVSITRSISHYFFIVLADSPSMSAPNSSTCLFVSGNIYIKTPPVIVNSHLSTLLHCKISNPCHILVFFHLYTYIAWITH